jgi:ArsR family transcriptional regulator
MKPELRSKLDHLLEEFQYCQKALNAIGDESRQQIICVMLRESSEKGMRVSEITQYTNLSRPAVSHHIQILKEAGIMKSYKVHTMIYYYLDPDAKMVRMMASLMQDITELTNCPAKNGGIQ